MKLKDNRLKYSRPALKHPTNVLRSNKAYLGYTLIYVVNPVGPYYTTQLAKASILAEKTAHIRVCRLSRSFPFYASFLPFTIDTQLIAEKTQAFVTALLCFQTKQRPFQVLT